MLLGVIADTIASWFEKIIEFISGFFAFIPMTIYFLYTSCCSVMDMFQALIRKLAGLDTYYVNGVKQSGDMLVSFVRGILGIDGEQANYSTLSTVFWSLIIFSVILLVLTTIIAIIKAHYNYDSKKSQPMTIIANSIKALFTMTLVPIVTIFGLYLSEIVLRFLDQITSSSSGQNITALYGAQANQLKEVGTSADGSKLYASYDFFGAGSPTSQTTFSGTMFKVAAYDCNRVRTGSFSTKSSSNSSWQDFGLFIDTDREALAGKIDEAFSSNLTVKEGKTCGTFGSDSWVLNSAYLVGGGAAWGLGLINVKNFSKYNVGLVYYYYNLWTFNYFLAFAGIVTMFTLLVNIIFGLMTRLIMTLALFLVYSPMVGIIPLDGGNAFKSWKKEFMSNILMAYGAVVGMNIFFLILPFLNTISFFNILVLDRIMSILFIIAGLSLVKKFIKLLSGFIGGADANETGKSVVDDVKATGVKAAKMTMATAAVGVGVGKLAMGTKAGWVIAPGAKGAGVGVKAISNAIVRKRLRDTYGDEVDRKEGESRADYNTRLSGLNRQYSEFKGVLKLGNVDKGEMKEKFAKASGTDEKKKVLLEAIVKNNDAVWKRGGMSDEEIKKKRQKMAENGIAEQAERSKAPAAPGSFKAFGQAVLDLTGSSLKLAGDLTGIASLGKTLGEGGVFDEGKTAMFKFAQAIGAVDSNAKQGATAFGTKKQKEDAEKDALKEQRKIQESIETSNKRTADEITKLINFLKEDKK